MYVNLSKKFITKNLLPYLNRTNLGSPCFLRENHNQLELNLLPLQKVVERWFVETNVDKVAGCP